METKSRKPIVTARTDNFHFSISFDPDTGSPCEFFIGGRGKVGQQLDIELSDLSVLACKIMQGE
tara:strand:- start:1168 stop:1359 length:192 start_codon:yes stop_codon:yes gene_type:complete